MLPKSIEFVNFDDGIGKSTSKFIGLQSVVIKKRFEVDKNQIFSSEKGEFQVIVFMIMLTRSSERIFNPMRYTDRIMNTCSYRGADTSVTIS